MNSTYYFKGPGGEWLGHKKYEEGVWRYSKFDGSSFWYTREEYENEFPGFYIPNDLQ